MNYYDHWFSNLSSTLPLEGLVDFGYLGVVFYGLLFGVFLKILSKKFDEGFKSKNIAEIYLVCSLLFIYRGPFLSSLAFSIGGYIGIKLSLLIFKYISKLQFKVN